MNNAKGGGKSAKLSSYVTDRRQARNTESARGNTSNLQGSTRGAKMLAAISNNNENQRWGMYHGSSELFFCKLISAQDKDGMQFVQKLQKLSQKSPSEERVLSMPSKSLLKVKAKDIMPVDIREEPFGTAFRVTTNSKDVRLFLGALSGAGDPQKSQGEESVVSLDPAVDSDDDDDDNDDTRTEASSLFQHLSTVPDADQKSTAEIVEREQARNRSESPLTIQNIGDDDSHYSQANPSPTILGATPLGSPVGSASKPPLAPKGDRGRGVPMGEGTTGCAIAFGSTNSSHSMSSGGGPSPQQSTRDSSKLEESFTDSPLIVRDSTPSSTGSSRSSGDGDSVAPLPAGRDSGETPTLTTFNSKFQPQGPGVRRAQPQATHILPPAAIFAGDAPAGEGSWPGFGSGSVSEAAEAAAAAGAGVVVGAARVASPRVQLGGGTSGFAPPQVRQMFAGAFHEGSSSSSSLNSSSSSSSSKRAEMLASAEQQLLPERPPLSRTLSLDGQESVGAAAQSVTPAVTGDDMLELSDNEEGDGEMVPAVVGGAAAVTGSKERSAGSDDESLLEAGEETEGESEEDEDEDDGGRKKEHLSARQQQQQQQQEEEEDDSDYGDEQQQQQQQQQQVMEASSDEDEDEDGDRGGLRDRPEHWVYSLEHKQGRRVARGALQAARSGGDTLNFVSSPEKRAGQGQGQGQGLALALSPVDGTGFASDLSSIGVVSSPESGGGSRSGAASGTKRSRALSIGSASSSGVKRGSGSVMDTSGATDHEFELNSSCGSAREGARRGGHKRRKLESKKHATQKGKGAGPPSCSLSSAVPSSAGRE